MRALATYAGAVKRRLSAAVGAVYDSLITTKRPASMTLPHSTSSVRLGVGVGLALAAAAIAALGLLGQLSGVRSLAFPGPGLPAMKANTAIAILCECAAWISLQTRFRTLHVVGYALAAAAAAIAAVTLLEDVANIDLGIDRLVSDDAVSGSFGRPGRMSLAIAVTLLFSALAIALTRAPQRRFEDLRQFARMVALAAPIFAIALHIFDPTAIGVINGFSATSLTTASAIVLLLIAISFDRPAASLRWQVAAIGVVVVAPLVALMVFFASSERETALSVARERLTAIARLGSERQDAVLTQSRQLLGLLARSNMIRDGAPGCDQELAHYLALGVGAGSLFVADRTGRILCSDVAEARSLNIGDRQYFRDAFATGRFTVSEFVLAKLTRKPRLVLALPIPEGPSADRLIGLSLDVDALGGPLRGLGVDGLGVTETLTLVDKSGVVLARQPRDEELVGMSLADATFVTQALANPDRAFEAAELSGRSTIFAARRVLNGEGTLIVGVSKHEVVRHVDARLNRQLLMITAILACSLALGVLGSETLLLRPLRRLISYAKRLEAGDLSARPDVRAGGEVGALGRALSVSAAAIEDRERRLAETEALFRGLFDHSPDAKSVIRVEADGAFRVETWNTAAMLATGLKASDVVGRTPTEVFPGARGDAIERDLNRTLSLGRVNTIEREPNVNGLPTVFEMVQVPLRNADGVIERIFLSARDISERKRVERLKNEFVSTVSHELRTPLTSIAGSLGLLSGGAAGPLGDRAKHLITIAHSNSLRLVRLINDILDIEKIEAGRMTFELKSLVLADVVGQAISGLKSYADEFGVTVDFPGAAQELMVYGDEDRLTQVVTNLLSNAIKFSPQGGDVAVTVAPDGEAVAILVKDRGPGIPESFRGRMFSKFAQADGSDSRRKGGTGLGLAIVREIVERHAGAITYRTAMGEGTEFEVRLPRHIVRDRARIPTFADRPSRPKVLVCEDDALMAAILAEQMRDAGFEGVTAGTIRAGLKICETENIEAVLVDLNLPDGDGLSLIRDIRATPRGKAMPVVVVSADAARGSKDERAKELGVAAWVEKPVDTNRLARLIRQQIGSAPNRPRVLHVEDDADLCNVVSAALAPFADVASVGSVAAARSQLEQTSFDLVILDVALEDGSGLDLMKTLETSRSKPIPTIIFSARDTDREVAARTDGAMTKSRTSLASLVETVKDILADSAAERNAEGGLLRRSYG